MKAKAAQSDRVAKIRNDLKDAKAGLATANANAKAYSAVNKAIETAKTRAVLKAEKVLLAELKKVANSEAKLVANALKPKKKRAKKKK